MVRRCTDLYREIKKQIAAWEEPDYAAFAARNLICVYTGRSREALLTDGGEPVPEQVAQAVEDGVRRLRSGEPLAYVLGEWDFFGMTLKVTPKVLIPRDDTCAVTELAIAALREMDKPLRVLDLCTGSGCIGLAIAREVPEARVVLADLSPEALEVARENAVVYAPAVSCVTADALGEPEPKLGQFDLIVSNPPYVTEGEMETLSPGVRNFEPAMALAGGTDGLDFYRAICANYRTALTPGGLLCFEFGMGQGDDVCTILEKNGFTVLQRTCDANQIERAVLARYGRKEDRYGNQKNRL